jgi:hypothetical protein
MVVAFATTEAKNMAAAPQMRSRAATADIRPCGEQSPAVNVTRMNLLCPIDNTLSIASKQLRDIIGTRNRFDLHQFRADRSGRRHDGMPA